MLRDQYDIAEFPEGNDLWLVKWIDEFRLPHLKTRSASVGVVLQQLSARDLTELDSLKATELSHILGRKKDACNPVFKVPRVMVGSLPVLEIGQIYQGRMKVGQLPTTLATIAIHKPVSAFEAEIELGQQVPPPPWWDKRFPHKTLNSHEYVGLFGMSKSRCDVIRRREGKHVNEYIIPKTVIFRAFYAMHSEMAKAFCNGPWSEKYQDVICMHDFESGLKTQEIDDGKQWNVVLETLVQDEFACPLALLLFDKHANVCAESIYARSMQDKNGPYYSSWYASAEIPYRPIYEPFRMRVKCLPLPNRTAIDGNQARYEVRRFVVTSIVGSSWPSHLPTVGIGRRNSGANGEVQIADSKSPPHARVDEGKNDCTKSVVDSTADAAASSTAQTIKGEEWIWLNKPNTVALTKKSSKRYEGRRLTRQGGKDLISTGEHTYEKDGLTKGEATVVVRSLERRFEQIVEILEELKAEGIITDIRGVPAPEAWQQQSRGGRPCWSFIAEAPGRLGKKNGRSWRIVDYGPVGSKRVVHRSALVLQLSIGGNPHYWIEIECRKNQGFRSPFLSNVGADYRDIIATSIEIIAIKKGLNLEDALKQAFSGKNIMVDSYRHYYKSKESSDLDISSVRRFLVGR